MKILNISKIKPYKNIIRRPFVIAEAGVNHDGSMEIAKRLIDEAKEGGADAIKFQTYKAETLASKNSPSYWDTSKEPTTSQFKLFKKHDKFWKNEFVELKIYCDKVGIEFMSIAFDIESSVFLNELMDVFKISSSDITNKPFIEHLCDFGKPIILSTGASHLYEIQQAVSWIEEKGNPLAILHCVLNYPTEDINANLGMIKGLKEKFPDKLIGYSDHTQPKDMKDSEIATLLGAVIIEKHFIHDKSLPGNDHYHAMDKNDLILFTNNLDITFKILGDSNVYPTKSQEISRRSLVAKQFIPKGEIIEKEDLTFKRPAFGVSSSFISDVIGKKAIMFVSTAIITRGLGPKAYGDFSFINNFFIQLIPFLIFSTSIAFFTKLSQRNNEFGLVRFFRIISSIALIATTSIIRIFWKEIPEANYNGDLIRSGILYKKVFFEKNWVMNEIIGAK